MSSPNTTVTPHHRELLDEDRYVRDKTMYRCGRYNKEIPYKIITIRDQQCWLMGKNVWAIDTN